MPYKTILVHLNDARRGENARTRGLSRAALQCPSHPRRHVTVHSAMWPSSRGPPCRSPMQHMRTGIHRDLRLADPAAPD
jgi:hypothetical protein